MKVVSGQTLGGWVLDVADKQGFLAAQGISLDRSVEDPGSNSAAGDVASRARDVGFLPTDRFMREAKEGQALVMVAGLVNKVTLSLIAARDVPGHRFSQGPADRLPRPRRRQRGSGEALPEGAQFRRQGRAVGRVSRPGCRRGRRSERHGRCVIRGAAAGCETPHYRLPVDRRGRRCGEGLSGGRDHRAPGLGAPERGYAAPAAPGGVAGRTLVTTPGNHDAAVQILAGTLHITNGEAAQVYDQYVTSLPAIPKEGDVDQVGVRAVAELLGEIGVLKAPLPDPVRLTDTTFLQKAKATVPR